MILKKLSDEVLIDKRDHLLLQTLIKSFVIIFPSGIYMLFTEFNILKSFLYLSFLVCPLMIPYSNLIHVVIHKKMFKNEYKILEYIHYFVIGIFLGETPFTHYTHHIGMHHPENNYRNDLSSTMHYNRDSILDFVKYLFKFVVCAYTLLFYLNRKKRKSFLVKTVLGEMSYIVITVAFLVFNPLQAITVFVLPLIILRIGMACTNWAQHAFLDKEDLFNNYKICTTIIDSDYNRKCFNDAFHIEHHSYPLTHWSNLEQKFIENSSKYIEHQSVVFHTLSYLQLFKLLMMKRYRKLASYYVDLSGDMSEKEIIELLKVRVAKIC